MYFVLSDRKAFALFYVFFFALSALFVTLYYHFFCSFLYVFWWQGIISWLEALFLVLACSNFLAAGIRTKPRLPLLLCGMYLLFGVLEKTMWGRSFFFHRYDIIGDDFITKPRDTVNNILCLFYWVLAAAAIHPKVPAFFAKINFPKPRLSYCIFVLSGAFFTLMVRDMFKLDIRMASESMKMLTVFTVFLISAEAFKPKGASSLHKRKHKSGAPAMVPFFILCIAVISYNFANQETYRRESGFSQNGGNILGLRIERPPKQFLDAKGPRVRTLVADCHCFVKRKGSVSTDTALNRFGDSTDSNPYRNLWINKYGIAFIITVVFLTTGVFCVRISRHQRDTFV